MAEPIPIDAIMTDLDGQWNASNVTKPALTTVNGASQPFRFDLNVGDQIIGRTASPAMSEDPIGNRKYGNRNYSIELELYTLTSRQRLYDLMLEVELPTLISNTGTIGYVNNIGHALLDYVEIEIGGNVIDRHYRDWLHIWGELTTTQGKLDGYYRMLGKYDVHRVTSFTGGIVIIPFHFWFCRQPGLALPLVALQHHDTIIRVKINTLEKLWKSSDGNGPSTIPHITRATLMGDYVYLDPPYAPENEKSFVGYTQDGFNLDTHKKLFGEIIKLNEKNIKFSMSNSNVDLIMKYFKDYKREEITARRAINSKKPGSTTTEVIISN